jgi:hypothetical protein
MIFGTDMCILGIFVIQKDVVPFEHVTLKPFLSLEIRD